MPVPSPTSQVAGSPADMNGWGGHQSRVVRTRAGVFTTYVVGTEPNALTWKLAHLETTGRWRVVASGVAGREPAHLLAGPDGTVYVVAAPYRRVTVWSGKPSANGSVRMKSSRVPGMPSDPVLYLSAGIDSRGDLCVLVSPSGDVAIACRAAGSTKWTSHTHQLDHRHCYSYLFPAADGTLTVVATRDVEWSELGWTQPPGGFAYDFSEFMVYRTNFTGSTFTVVHQSEEVQTPAELEVLRNAQADAFVDRSGRIHVLYWRRYPGSDGTENWHMMLDSNGQVLADHRILADAGFQYLKLTQGADGRFWLFLNRGTIEAFDPVSGAVDANVGIDLGGLGVEYSGFSLTVPRGGASRSDLVDVVYPASDGSWRYFSATLP